MCFAITTTEKSHSVYHFKKPTQTSVARINIPSLCSEWLPSPHVLIPRLDADKLPALWLGSRSLPLLQLSPKPRWFLGSQTPSCSWACSCTTNVQSLSPCSGGSCQPLPGLTLSLPPLCMYVLSCSVGSTLCSPKGCSPAGSSVHATFQARTPARVAIRKPRGSSQVWNSISRVWGTGRWILYHQCCLGSPYSPPSQSPIHGIINAHPVSLIEPDPHIPRVTKSCQFHFRNASKI